MKGPPIKNALESHWALIKTFLIQKPLLSDLLTTTFLSIYMQLSPPLFLFYC